MNRWEVTVDRWAAWAVEDAMPSASTTSGALDPLDRRICTLLGVADPGPAPAPAPRSEPTQAPEPPSTPAEVATPTSPDPAEAETAAATHVAVDSDGVAAGPTGLELTFAGPRPSARVDLESHPRSRGPAEADPPPPSVQPDAFDGTPPAKSTALDPAEPPAPPPEPSLGVPQALDLPPTRELSAEEHERIEREAKLADSELSPIASVVDDDELPPDPAPPHAMSEAGAPGPTDVPSPAREAQEPTGDGPRLFIPVSLTQPEDGAQPEPAAAPEAELEEVDDVEAAVLEPEELEPEDLEDVSDPDVPASPPAAKQDAHAQPEKVKKPPAPPPERRRRAWFDDVFAEHFASIMPPRSDEAAVRDVDFIVESLKLPEGASVLDVGCGDARHAIALARKGYQVTGIDNSMAQLLHASGRVEKAGVEVTVMHGDMREIPSDRDYDAILCLGTTLGYFDEDVNRQVLEGMKERLRPGGRLVVQVVNRDFLAPQLPARSWWQGRKCMVLDEAELNFFANRLRIHRTIIFEDGRQFEHYMFIRAFSVHDLGKTFSQVGLRVNEVSGSRATRGRFYGSASPEIWIVAQAKETPNGSG